MAAWSPTRRCITWSPRRRRRSRITFQVDLFPARAASASIEDVGEREKDIRYSCTRTVTNTLRQMHDVRHNINLLWTELMPEQRALPEAKYLYAFGCVTTMDIVQLIYRPQQMQGQTKDYEVQPLYRPRPGPLGAGVFRCDDDAGRLALAGAGAGGGGAAHLRRAGGGDVNPEKPPMKDSDRSGLEGNEGRGSSAARRAPPRSRRGGPLMSTAGFLVAFAAYGAVGLLVGLGFLLFAIDRMDPAAAGAYAFRPAAARPGAPRGAGAAPVAGFRAEWLEGAAPIAARIFASGWPLAVLLPAILLAGLAVRLSAPAPDVPVRLERP